MRIIVQANPFRTEGEEKRVGRVVARRCRTRQLSANAKTILLCLVSVCLHHFDGVACRRYYRVPSNAQSVPGDCEINFLFLNQSKNMLMQSLFIVIILDGSARVRYATAVLPSRAEYLIAYSGENNSFSTGTSAPKSSIQR